MGRSLTCLGTSAASGLGAYLTIYPGLVVAPAPLHRGKDCPGSGTARSVPGQSLGAAAGVLLLDHLPDVRGTTCSPAQRQGLPGIGYGERYAWAESGGGCGGLALRRPHGAPSMTGLTDSALYPGVVVLLGFYPGDGGTACYCLLLPATAARAYS